MARSEFQYFTGKFSGLGPEIRSSHFRHYIVNPDLHIHTDSTGTPLHVCISVHTYTRYTCTTADAVLSCCVMCAIRNVRVIGASNFVGKGADSNRWCISWCNSLWWYHHHRDHFFYQRHFDERYWVSLGVFSLQQLFVVYLMVAIENNHPFHSSCSALSLSLLLR